MKVIYIAGDGRSGSTLIDAVLSNSKNSISVGESYRFWRRFYQADTLCGCTQKIEVCSLWKRIDSILTTNIENYDPKDTWNRIQYLLKFKNVRNISKIIKNPNWKLFCDTVKLFYKSISENTGKDIIIDSSKSSGWLYLLIALDFCELKIIHLERNLQSVANSWKKKVYLPEYYNKQVQMPIKTNFVILKNWIKIKYLCMRLKKQENYLFVKYENFIIHPKKYFGIFETNIGIVLPENFKNSFNHSIGGNPMRSKISEGIVIDDKKEDLTNLSNIEQFYFSIINGLSNLII